MTDYSGPQKSDTQEGRNNKVDPFDKILLANSCGRTPREAATCQRRSTWDKIGNTA